MDGESIGYSIRLFRLTPDINIGTRSDLGKYKEIGAGDQGIIYGFACDETPELLPLPYVLATKMMRVFEEAKNPVFAPDGKGQITVEYNDEGKPVRVATVLMSNAIDYRHVPEGFRISIEPLAKADAMHCSR